MTARDSQPKHVTPWSFLWFVPLFIKYHVIPGQIRYAWWLVWSAMLVARYQIRKRLILQGEQLACNATCWCLHAALVYHFVLQCYTRMQNSISGLHCTSPCPQNGLHDVHGISQADTCTDYAYLRASCSTERHCSVCHYALRYAGVICLLFLFSTSQ